MSILDKILGALHLNFLNRKNSPSQKLKLKGGSKISGDVVIGNKKSQSVSNIPNIRVLPKTAVSDFKRYDFLNIYIEAVSEEPLYILKSTFDGILLSSEPRRLDGKDTLHFSGMDQNRMEDGYEPSFILNIRTQAGRKFLFTTKLRIKKFGNRHDLQVPTSNETIKEIE